MSITLKYFNEAIIFFFGKDMTKVYDEKPSHRRWQEKNTQKRVEERKWALIKIF